MARVIGMQSRSSFKVESSFPHRANRRKKSSSSVSPENNSQSLISASNSIDEAMNHDPNEFLVHHEISLSNPYFDQGKTKTTPSNSSFEYGPQLESNYLFNDNTSSLNWSGGSQFDWSQRIQPSLMSGSNLGIPNMNINNSANWSTAVSLNDSDPLVFLKSQESKLWKELEHLLLKHAQFLKEGHGKVNKARSVILHHLNQLHEIHQAMKEIYVSKKTSKFDLVHMFERWELKKHLLLTKIHDIQGDSNEEGVRFQQLLAQSNEVDNEIEELELKLKLLKQKRNVLRLELESSQSVIESKASSYIESLEVIENDEKILMERLSMPLPNTSNAAVSSLETENSVFLSSLNISKYFGKNKNPGSDPQASDKHFKVSPLLTEPYKPQVDCSLALELLKKQIELIDDELEKQETESFKFQESSIIWTESVGNVSRMENNFKNNITNIDESMVVTTLQKTLDLLEKQMELLSKFRLDLVSKAISNEISTLRKALFIITKDSTFIQVESSGTNTPSSSSSAAGGRKTSTPSKFSPPLVSGTQSNPASLPALTLANSGPPIILGAEKSKSNRRKSSVFSNFSLANDKNVKKD